MIYNTDQPNSDSSTDNSEDKPNVWVHSSVRLMEKRPLRFKRKQILTAPQPPVVPIGHKEKHVHNVIENETLFSTRCK